MIILAMLFVCSMLSAFDDQKIINRMLESSTKYLFKVDEESFLLKMTYDNNNLVYRAVYPFNNIETPGTYRISTMVNNNLAINTSDVTLNLNGNTVGGQVTIASGLENITIINGVIDTDTDNGLLINAGCANITLQDLTVRNATRGVYAQGLVDSMIMSCDFSRNTTGLELDTCHNITVRNCNAISNINAGFCLLTSTTCTFIECQALSTGENNNATSDQTIFGFVSANGNGNIFKQCTANSTQGLSVTDSDSLIAGFALRGSASNSSICQCAAANATSSASGLTVPYGILLEESISSPLEVTDSDAASSTRTVSWSPDGNYFASASFSDNAFRIYALDRTTELLTLVVDQFENGPTAVSWSLDGRYIAVGIFTSAELKIYAFDNIAESISLVALQATASGVNTGISWSPDGNYLAVSVTGANKVDIYFFNKVAQSVNFLTSAGSGGMVTGANSPLGVQWSPDGNYLAVGFANSNVVYLYSFDRSTGALSVVTTNSSGLFPYAVSWSPDGRYLAVAFDNSNVVRVFSFNGASLSPIAVTSSITDCRSVSWSADGKYLSVAVFSANLVHVYRFNSSAGLLTFVAQSETITNPYWVDWSPDGGYIAVAANTTVDVCKALTFPSNNVIQNNTIYDNSGGSIPSGIGISGSSIENLMIGNSSFDNPISPFMVYNNYAFVTNVYNQNFGAPTMLQNLSFGSTDPIQTPDDIILRLERSISKACDIQSKVDILLDIYG